MNENDKRTLTLDVDYYQALLDDPQLTENEKCELIETLWSIVVSFIDLGFELHPLQNSDIGIEADNSLHPAVSQMIADVVNENLEKPTCTVIEGSEA